MLELSQEIKDKVLQFLDKSGVLRNQWIGDDKMEVYLRISRRLYKNQVVQVFDIATIEVDEEYRFQGLTKQFLQFCRANSPYSVRVENCYNPSLQIHLNNQGWIQVDFDYYAPD
jgi:hypothetical protein